MSPHFLIFGVRSLYLSSLASIVEDINGYEAEFKALSLDALKACTEAFKERLKKGESADDLLAEAFALVREASRRTLNQRHFDVQLIGGIVLHQGKIAEMKTGEGKTLVATLPLYLNALVGKGVHLVTPNDYLSKIGAGWMGPVYHALGITVGVVTHDQSFVYDPEYRDPQSHGDERLNHFKPASRHEAYGADITYGTNNEFGFDYLRDNLEYMPSSLRQREFYFAIVDEVDSILIDEARTPLIISMPDQESAELYHVFSGIVPHLEENIHYNVDEKLKAVAITDAGIDKIEKTLNVENIYEEKGIRFVRHLEQALRAQALFFRDRDYVVKDGEVIIVDEFTGRLMPGRRWSDGLHQAIEAKEHVKVEQESRTLASITFQNYFRMYSKLAGMTGTAETSAEEFHKVYSLDVVSIPTHRPTIRGDYPDLIFRTERGKFQAVVREVKGCRERGQPVLIGTVSIEKNERLSRMLEVEGVPHQVLNAKNHEREALIIAQAGRKGAVTVATNMAGRGVDIILGGNPSDGKEADEVRASSGLYVIGTERHEARRIDNQLRGRAGRQGDPGSSRFFVSLEDDLMRIFGSDKIKRMMERFGIPEDQPIEHRLVSRAIESAQAKIEGFHFDTRKHVLDFDDVLNKQRDAIYRMRREILFANEGKKNEAGILSEENEKTISLTLKDQILSMIKENVEFLVAQHTASDTESEWNIEEIFETVKAIASLPDSIHQELRSAVSGEGHPDEKRMRLIEKTCEYLKNQYDAREARLGSDGMRNIERAIMLRSIDALWMDHLDQMEHLRDSVRLRAYGQRGPLVEYKHEGSKLYRELQTAIRTQVAHAIFKVGEMSAGEPERRVQESRPEVVFHEHVQGSAGKNVAHAESGNRHLNSPSEPAVGRNDQCPCGSGKKYKKCHGV